MNGVKPSKPIKPFLLVSLTQGRFRCEIIFAKKKSFSGEEHCSLVMSFPTEVRLIIGSD
jgi:hypothetical protein